MTNKQNYNNQYLSNPLDPAISPSIFLTPTTPSPNSQCMKRCRYLLLCRGVLVSPRDPAPGLGISNGRISTHLQKVFTSSSKSVSVVSPSTCLGKLVGEMVRFWRKKFLGILGRVPRSSNTEPYFCPLEKYLPPLCGFWEGAPRLVPAKGRPLLKAPSLQMVDRDLSRRPTHCCRMLRRSAAGGRPSGTESDELEAHPCMPPESKDTGFPLLKLTSSTNG